MKRNMVQDDLRENMQIELFDLNPYSGRSNKYIPDAWYLDESGVKYDIELKSTTTTRNKFSTSRDFGYNKIESWKGISGGFVFSVYDMTNNDEINFTQHIYCSVSQMMPWFLKIKEKIDMSCSAWNRVKNEINCTSEEFEQMDRLMMKGASLNDPSISTKDLIRWGELIDHRRPAEHLRELVSRYAKTEVEEPVIKNNLTKFISEESR
jgi:hypothetical protein